MIPSDPSAIMMVTRNRAGAALTAPPTATGGLVLMHGERTTASTFHTDKWKPVGSCWMWTGGHTSEGYGMVRAGSKMRLAHRASYEHHVGPIPEGLTIDHLCRNPPCVNPAHLEPVTQGVNTLRGESPSAKNARKTHCKRGHPFSAVNTYVTPAGARACRACWRVRYAERKAA